LHAEEKILEVNLAKRIEEKINRSYLSSFFIILSVFGLLHRVLTPSTPFLLAERRQVEII
jgi:hypothetical protein